MNTSKITYKGNLRTESTHLKSSTQIITDAPTDNHGKGEAFSPTDLLATSLPACMITIIGIVADKNELELGKIEAEIKKVMDSNPRRGSEIYVNLTMENKNYSEKEVKLLETAALNCPVAKSIHPDIKQIVDFKYI